MLLLLLLLHFQNVLRAASACSPRTAIKANSPNV
jgi:hypothetical protein